MNRFLTSVTLITFATLQGTTLYGDITEFTYAVDLDPDVGTNPHFVFQTASDASATTPESALGTPTTGPLSVFRNNGPPISSSSPFGDLTISSAGTLLTVTLDLETGFTGIGSGSGWTFAIINPLFTVATEKLDTFVYESGSATSGMVPVNIGVDPDVATFTLDAGDTTTDGGILAYNFRFSSAAAAAAVPEPSTFVVWAVGLFSAWGIRRRRNRQVAA